MGVLPLLAQLRPKLLKRSINFARLFLVRIILLVVTHCIVDKWDGLCWFQLCPCI